MAGAQYFLAVALVPGAFPAGWFFGVDISFAELMAEYDAGFPFIGTLDANGASSFLIPGGVPSGLSIYAVTVQFTPGFGQFLLARPPVSHTIP